jgi:signal transduction histidine kinase
VEVARRAARLLKVFGEFARPASRESAPVPLTQVAEDALRLSRHALRKAGVETRLHRAGDDRLVAPADRLLQVVLALLHAAIEHTAPAGGGTVEVLVERIEDEVWLELSARATRPEAAGEAAVAEAGARDAGPGADASPSQAGTAELSLYVARRIVADLGGKLRTRRPGRGRWLYCLMLPAVGAAGAAPR